MCETLDEIHEAQLAAVIEKLRKKKAKEPLKSSHNSHFKTIPMSIKFE